MQLRCRRPNTRLRNFEPCSAVRDSHASRHPTCKHQAASSNDSIELTHRATTLEDSVDQALTDYRSFRRSLSQQQEVEEKPRMKKLIKAAHSISKDGDALSQRLQEIPLDPRRLASLAEHLERAFSEFQAAQARLGKEMAIEPQ